MNILRENSYTNSSVSQLIENSERYIDECFATQTKTANDIFECFATQTKMAKLI